MDKQYKSILIDNLQQGYEKLFDEIRHEDSSKKLMKTMSNDIVNNLRELNGIIKEAKTIDERKEVIKDILNVELGFCETVMKTTSKDIEIASSNTLEDTRRILNSCLTYFDRDLLNEDTYQSAYSRYDTPKQLTSKGLPKDNIILFTNLER